MIENINALGLALDSDLTELKVISQNLANVTTTGYKREIMASTGKSFLSAMNEAGQAERSSSEVVQDMRQGLLKKTSSVFDMALEGDVFFAVSNNGDIRFTKKGEMMLDQNGYLSLVSGEHLLANGQAVALNPGEFEVLPDGIILQDEVAISQLDIVGFEDQSGLQYMGGGQYDATTPGLSADPSEYKVHHGFVERSNVVLTDEMIKLVTLNRHVESLSAVMKGYDSMLDTAINELGNI